MIIVDDRLSLDVLAGRLRDARPYATTWGFHYRLTRALADPSVQGRLSRASDIDVRSVVADPPPERLVILDPRQFTALAADVSVRHGLNLLAAELVAAAIHHRAELHLSSSNVGRAWPAVLDAEGIRLTVL